MLLTTVALLRRHSSPPHVDGRRTASSPVLSSTADSESAVRIEKGAEMAEIEGKNWSTSAVPRYAKPIIPDQLHGTKVRSGATAIPSDITASSHSISISSCHMRRRRRMQLHHTAHYRITTNTVPTHRTMVEYDYISRLHHFFAHSLTNFSI